MMKITRKDKFAIMFMVACFLVGLIVGIIVGIDYQQKMNLKTLEEVGGVLDGMISSMELNINFNETKIIEEFNKTIVPELKQEVDG